MALGIRVPKVRFLLLATALMLSVSAHAEPVATVIFASGNVFATAASGDMRALTKSTLIDVGDTIDTRDGRVQLQFTDGALMSLQPQTLFRVDEYHYSGTSDGKERGFFTLLKGGLRTITGAIGRAKQSAYQVITRLATIGVRGTEYSLALTPVGAIGSIGEGGIDVCNGGGCFRAASGESFAVAGTNASPRMAAKKTDLAPKQPESTAAGFASGESRGRNGELLAVVLPPAGPAVVPPVPDTRRGAAFIYPQQQSVVMASIAATAATLDAVGGLREIDVCANQCNTQWSGRIADSHHDALIAWGRWTGDKTKGQSIDLSNGGSLHYVVGSPGDVNIESLRARNVVAEYSLLGGTQPTLAHGGVTGTVTDAKLVAHFTADPHVEFGVRVNANGVALTGVGTATILGSTFSGVGAAPTRGNPNPAASMNGFSANTSVEFAGFFAGSNAERAGVAYQLDAGRAAITGALSLQQAPTASNR